MSSNPKISVIMPSLNVAKFITPCMESVLQQTLQNIEILAIDAGSVDGTWEILQDYNEKDERIHLIKSDMKSYGYQVNLGIARAKGKYIAIVETDDVIDSEMFEHLYKLAVENDLDYIKGNYYLFTELKNSEVWKMPSYIFPLNSDKYDIVLNPQENKELSLMDIYLWKGLYKRNFLLNNDIQLNETKGAAFQDVGFLFQTFAYATRAMYVKDAYYYYRQDNSGASIVNPKGFQYLVDEYTFLKKFYEKNNLWNMKWKVYYYTRMYQQVATRYRTMAAYGELWNDTEEQRSILHSWLTEAYQAGYIDESGLGDILWLELLQYIEDEDAYWNYQKSIYKGKKALLQEVKSITEDSKEIVFYSTSVRNDFLVPLINTIIPDAVICFCDNNPSKQGVLHLGYEVYSVEEVVERYPDALYIIGNRRYNKSMKQQLVDLGIPLSKIRVSKMEFDLLMLHAASQI